MFTYILKTYCKYPMKLFLIGKLQTITVALNFNQGQTAGII